MKNAKTLDKEDITERSAEQTGHSKESSRTKDNASDHSDEESNTKDNTSDHSDDEPIAIIDNKSESSLAVEDVSVNENALQNEAESQNRTMIVQTNEAELTDPITDHKTEQAIDDNATIGSNHDNIDQTNDMDYN